MVLRKKHIRKLARHLAGVAAGTSVTIGISNLELHSSRLQRAGFTSALEVGEKVLPTVVGPKSRFNAEGKYIKHKDQPMETAYRTREWSWTEWDGTEHTDFVEVPYKRYPRTLVPPPSVELKIVETDSGQKLVVADVAAVPYRGGENETLLHLVNLMLELFGECHVFTASLGAITVPTIKHLNWKVLPPGRRPWPEVQRDVEPLITRARKGNQAVVKNRFETLTAFSPDFMAVGHGGFGGYVVFGYEKLNRYVFESIHPDNATYVFDGEWEDLSRLSKAAIIAGDLQKARVIHRLGSWRYQISELLGGNDALLAA